VFARCQVAFGQHGGRADEESVVQGDLRESVYDGLAQSRSGLHIALDKTIEGTLDPKIGVELHGLMFRNAQCRYCIVDFLQVIHVRTGWRSVEGYRHYTSTSR